MSSLADIGVIALGCALGGLFRFWVITGMESRFPRLRNFPWATLCVNTSGAFFIGLFAGSGSLWSFAVIGFLGSYTTVSSFSLQTLALAQTGRTVFALWNVLLSFTLCLFAVWAGLTFGHVIEGTPP